jgi:DNA-binding HxlR family transcriptional regulator
MQGIQKPEQLKVEFKSCPVRASLGVLGKKWALLILRNIGVYRAQRFNEMLSITHGLTKRVLSNRLRELKHAGYIEVTDSQRRYVKWDLTEKGRDVLPILMGLVLIGSKYYSDQVFEDKKSRGLNEIFEMTYIQKVTKNLVVPIPEPC